MKLRRQIELTVTHDDEALAEINRPIAYFSPFPNGYDQVIAMTFDDIPFGGTYPTSGHDPGSKSAQYLVRLLEDHPKMKMGWIILPDAILSVDDLSNPDYPPGNWWLAHSKRRILTYYPEDYHQWLRNIDRDSLVYGYEHRVHLGSHGYHHTPEGQYEDFEFQYYDPAFDDSTCSAIVREYRLLGLSPRSHKWMRFPGLAFTRAAIDALTKYDFILFDYWSGLNAKLLPWMLFYSEHGRIWAIATRWDGDPPMPYEVMAEILDGGKLCHTGMHPWSWFDYYDGDPEARYPEISAMFQQAEIDFPNLGYMCPDEVGYFADETYEISDIASEIVCDTLVVSFVGSTTLGQTLIVEWPDGVDLPSSFSVDEADVADVETRGRRLVVRLPALANEKHIVRMSPAPGEPCEPVAPPFHSIVLQNQPNPFRSETVIRFWLPQATHVTLTVYDLSGRRVAIVVDTERESGMNEARWNGRNSAGEEVASGIYFCRLDVGTTARLGKLTLVR